ncbi:MAG: hypothetical protein KA059_02895 [Elusimicrobiales bacterium]|nr:hypothetical protein [Elusimicrobiales bacterium]
MINILNPYAKYKDSGNPLSVTISQGIIRQEDQNGVIKLVDKILAITKDNDYLENPQKQAKVQDYELQIDQMVYKLYGLTDEEIKIVEGLGKK